MKVFLSSRHLTHWLRHQSLTLAPDCGFLLIHGFSCWVPVTCMGDLECSWHCSWYRLHHCGHLGVHNQIQALLLCLSNYFKKRERERERKYF